MLVYQGKEVLPGTPEADAVTVRMWKNLIQCYQMDKGMEVSAWDEITVRRGDRILCDTKEH